MKYAHDEKCERFELDECFCEVRALESHLSALKPLVRAAVEWEGVAGTPTRAAVFRATRDLPPALREWAMKEDDK